jgi:hypothetical protein
MNRKANPFTLTTKSLHWSGKSLHLVDMNMTSCFEIPPFPSVDGGGFE